MVRFEKKKTETREDTHLGVRHTKVAFCRCFRLLFRNAVRVAVCVRVFVVVCVRVCVLVCARLSGCSLGFSLAMHVCEQSVFERRDFAALFDVGVEHGGEVAGDGERLGAQHEQTVRRFGGQAAQGMRDLNIRKKGCEDEKQTVHAERGIDRAHRLAAETVAEQSRSSRAS